MLCWNFAHFLQIRQGQMTMLEASDQGQVSVYMNPVSNKAK
jgi:hypothetical protein